MGQSALSLCKRCPGLLWGVSQSAIEEEEAGTNITVPDRTVHRIEFGEDVLSSDKHQATQTDRLTDPGMGYGRVRAITPGSGGVVIHC